MIPIVILIPMSPTTLWSKALNVMERIKRSSRSKCCRNSERIVVSGGFGRCPQV